MVSIPALRYLEYALTKKHSESNKTSQEILDNTHPALKYEVLEKIYIPIFQKISGLDKLPVSVLGKLAQYASQSVFSPGQIIVDVLFIYVGGRHEPRSQSVLHRKWLRHDIP